MNFGLVRRGYSATGGAEAYLKRFARALATAGHSSTLFTSADWPREDWPGDRIERLAGGDSPLAFANALQTARAGAGCDYLFSLERVLDCDAYRAGDGVHRAWLERRARFEPFWKRWGRVFNPKHRELLALEQRLFAAQQAGTIIANCKMVKEEIVQIYGYPAERIHVVYNGLPAFTPSPELREATRAQLGIAPSTPVVLFAGSGWERKGLAAAVEGIRLVKSAMPPLLLIAGRGNTRRYQGGERVRFLGPVRQMAACYAAADLFVLPTFYDPFSNACLEALAAGLPVITTRANGFSEIVQPGINSEVLEDPSDAAGIARAIEAWSDPQRRAAIRPELLELAGRFTMEANVRNTLAAMGVGA
jgi:UDP-glucose:(heptosyl)LPS alpha-1,3-glucosyltransferase